MELLCGYAGNYSAMSTYYEMAAAASKAYPNALMTSLAQNQVFKESEKISKEDVKVIKGIKDIVDKADSFAGIILHLLEGNTTAAEAAANVFFGKLGTEGAMKTTEAIKAERDDFFNEIRLRREETTYDQKILNDQEAEYAKRIYEAYGSDSLVTYMDWIRATRRGYKLTATLLKQAYGKKVKDAFVHDKTYDGQQNVEIHYDYITVYDDKGKEIGKKEVPVSVEGDILLKGSANIPDVKILLVEGNFIQTHFDNVQVRKKVHVGPIQVSPDSEFRNSDDINNVLLGKALADKEEEWDIDETFTGEIELNDAAYVIANGDKHKKQSYLMEETASYGYHNNEISPGVQIEDNMVYLFETTNSTALSGKEINMQIGGTVWNDIDFKAIKNDMKSDNGKIDENDLPAAGIQVQLYEADTDNLVGTTTTDLKGNYRFFGLKNGEKPLINPLKKYYINYTYDGQKYEQTYFKKSLSGEYSNAKEIDRNKYNITFENINSYSENVQNGHGYNNNGTWKKTFARDEKIKNEDGTFIKENDNVITYEKIYIKFLSMAVNGYKENDEPSTTDCSKIWDRQKDYEWILNGNENQDSIKNWLTSLGTSENVSSDIIEFIKDTFIKATTREESLYPVYNQFVINNVSSNIETYQYSKSFSIKLDKNFAYLYTVGSDQSRNVNDGIRARLTNELTLQNDIYKITTIENGKKHEYKYNERSNDNLENSLVSVRATENSLNENAQYYRKIRSSDYLYNPKDINDNEKKKLQVYVTYRIEIKNLSALNTKIREIVNYYDDDVYEFDGKIEGDTYNINVYNDYTPSGEISNSYVNSYNGANNNGKKVNDSLVVRKIGINGEKEYISKQNYNYNTIYISGITSKSGDIILEPGETTSTYITYKVKYDENGRLKLGKDAGINNIAEINAYSSYYSDLAQIADYLDEYDNPVNKQININEPAGIIDVNSNPGSVSAIDIEENGNIIMGHTEDNTGFDITKDRQEDDIDKAPNLKLVIDTDDNNTRRIRGYTFEDARNNTSNTGKAVIGDGKFDENIDRKVNGVTVELVELISDVDENGIFKGTYSGEKVWATYNYNDLQNPNIDNSRYASGRGESRIIINGPEGTILHVDNDPLSEGKGEYDFKSIPPGDFYVRFKYGDTAETTMIDSTKIEDPNNPICVVNNTVGNIDGLTGKNLKSYNGQDYKSTIYQQYLTQDINYNGIRGFENSESQNYSNMDDTGTNNGTDKNSMYYYDIAVGDGSDRSVSDAKDVYYYRKRANEYSTELRNNKAEILASFMKPSTYKIYEYDDSGNIKLDAEGNGIIKQDEQRALQTYMIKELMENTHMVSQTGIINTQIEYNTNNTNALGENLHYTIEDLNLGLTERPIAQISLNNRVENVEIKLANGKTILNTNQTVNNLFFANHQPHTTIRENIGENSIIKKNNINKNSENKNTPELILFYMDNELRENATVNIRYKLMVENTGEVDYTDKHFYYKGIENDPDKNIATTNVKKIINYINNPTKYDQNTEKNGEIWKTETPNNLIPSTKVVKKEQTTTDFSKINLDYVNREYTQEVNTYNIIVTTDKLSKELVPTCNDKGESSTDEIPLTLSTTISGSNEQDNLIYNNLAEIIETTNSLGRSCKYSAVGDREMPDQKLGNDAASNAKSYMDRIKPLQVDTDSAQKIVILPPTG